MMTMDLHCARSGNIRGGLSGRGRTGDRRSPQKAQPSSPTAAALLVILTLALHAPEAASVSLAETVTSMEGLKLALASGVSEVTVEAPYLEAPHVLPPGVDVAAVNDLSFTCGIAEEPPGNLLVPLLFSAPAAKPLMIPPTKAAVPPDNQQQPLAAVEQKDLQEDLQEEQEQEQEQEQEAYFPLVVGLSTRLVCGMLGGQRCMLSGQGRGQRAFVVQAGGHLHLEGFRLSGWSAPEGGALRVGGGGRVTLINCTFDNNNAGGAGPSANSEIGFSWGQTWSQVSSGGAILITGGVVDAESVEFVSNTAAPAGSASATGQLEGFGGAVALMGPEATLTCVDCSFSDNYAGAMGGAVAAVGGARAALQFGVMSNNQAVLGGGAMAALSGSTLELSSLTAAKNSANSGAGGAAAAEGEGTLLLISNCSLTGNEAGGLGLGGALALASKAQGHLSHCSLGLNSADQRGGAISLESASVVSLVNSSVTGNVAVVGGGVDAHGDGTELEVNLGCEFVENEALISGGHISVREEAHAVAKGTRLALGWAGKMGGALYVSGGGALVAAELLLEDNEASQGAGGLGGALLLDGGSAVLENGAVMSNRAAVGGAACVLTGGQLVLYGGVVGSLLMQDNTASPGQPGSAIVVVGSGSSLVVDGVTVDPLGASWSLPPILLKDGSAVMVSAVSFGNSSDWDSSDSADILVDDMGGDPVLLQMNSFPNSPVPAVQYSSGGSGSPTTCAPLICTGTSQLTTLSDSCSPALSDEASSQLLLDDTGCHPAPQRLLLALLPVLTAAPPGSCEPPPAETLCPEVLTFVADSSCPGNNFCATLPAPPQLGSSPPPPPPPPPPEDVLDGGSGEGGFLEQENTGPVPGSDNIPWQTPQAPASIPTSTPVTTSGQSPSPPPPSPSPPPSHEVGTGDALTSAPPSASLQPPSTIPPGPLEDSYPPLAPKPPSSGGGQPDPVVIGVISAALFFIFFIGALVTCLVCRMNRRRDREDSESLKNVGSAAIAMYKTRGLSPSRDSDSSSLSSDANGGLLGLRSCYGFFPCGRFAEEDDRYPGVGSGSAYAFKGGAPPPAHVHQPARQPALPNLVSSPRIFGRSDVHVTLPGRLLQPPPSPGGSSPSSNASRGLIRRGSCPDLLEFDYSPGTSSRSLLAKHPEAVDHEQLHFPLGQGRLPPPSRDLRHSAVHRTIERDPAAARSSAPTPSMPPEELSSKLKRTTSLAPAGSGLSEQEWVRSGLVEVDFSSELQPNLIKQIGSGAFGDVFLAKWRGRDVAVKIFNRGFGGATADQAESFRQEVLMMTRLGHGCRQIVSIYGACFQQPHMALIYQYIPGGTLYDRIHDSKMPPLSHLEVLRIGRDLASGLAYLHPYVVHRDLKPMNILLDGDGTAMLIDFGVSRERDPKHSYFNTKAGGTPAYMAPEMFNGDKFSEKVDVYAVACILCECLSRESPWSDQTNFGMIVYAVSLMDERPDIPQSCPDRLRRLISKCWQREPHSRPSCYEIMHKLSAMIREEEHRLAAVAERRAREQDVELGAEVRRVLSNSSSPAKALSPRQLNLKQAARNAV